MSDTDLPSSPATVRQSREGGGGRTQRAGDMASGKTARSGGAQQSAFHDDDESSAPAHAHPTAPSDFVEWGPPPDLQQRELIFDSLNKIVSAQPQRGAGNKTAGGMNGGKADSRGTYIFTWGAGYHGQLGRKFVRGQKKYSAIPMQVDMPSVIRQVTCGGLHTAIVTEEGKVYTFGDGRKGELGHIHDPSLKQTPRPVEMLDHVFITSITCGGSHTIAISDAGFLYSWGWARYGQCGHGDRQNQKFPKKIEHPLVREVVQVGAGNKHTMCVLKSGACLAWGANRHGQCGLGDFEDRLEPVRVPKLPAPTEGAASTVAFVACGAIHSALVSATGQVYIAGFGEFFTPSPSGAPAAGSGAGVGVGGQQHFFPTPTLVDLPEPISTVSCGQAHILALSVSHNVYALGSGDYGQIGFGVRGNSATPRLVIDTGNVRAVSAGRYHSFALTDAGVLYSWGCGENGQLGLNSDENILLPTVVTPILGTVVGQVSCGEHHTAILTSAPWTKLSNDVHEWLHAAKVEHELRVEWVRQTRRGLTSKDLAKLAQRKAEWAASNLERKKEVQAEEKSYIAAEVASVLFEKQLQQSVAQAMKRGSGGAAGAAAGATGGDTERASGGGIKPLLFPAIPDAQAVDEEEEKKATSALDSRHSARLPTVGTKKLAKAGGSMTERAGGAGGAQAQAQNAPLDGSATVRASSGGAGESFAQTQRAHTSGGNSSGASAGNPGTRTQFLKETAGTIKRMTAVIHDKGEAQSQKELQENIAAVFACRKEYDQLRHLSRALSKRLDELRREAELHQDGQASSVDSKESNDVRLQNLQMQLNTVTIKIAETSENRRNYELNIAHLKEEDFEHFNQLKALRKQNTDTNLYVKKMNDLRATSVQEKSKSEAELAQFKSEIAVYQQFVATQRDQFQSILDIVRLQNEKREVAKVQREEKATASVAQRVTQLNTEQAHAEKESGSLSHRLLSLDLKLRHFEDSFQKISAATGLNHPDAIVQKFFFKGEIRQQLQSEIDDKQHRLDTLRAEEEKLRADLESTKLSSKDQTWRDVEQLSESTREVSTRSERSQKEIERVTQRLAFVQEGLLYLMKSVEAEADSAAKRDEAIAAVEAGRSLPGHLDDLINVKGLWTPAQSTAVFSKLESTVDTLFASIAREQEQRQALELSSQQRNAASDKDGDRSDQPKLFGFNMKSLRLLSANSSKKASVTLPSEQQSQEQQQQQQQDQQQDQQSEQQQEQGEDQHSAEEEA